MPEVSRFLGIVVYLNINEHNPPHFHAKYGDFQVSIDIETGIIKGEFPKKEHYFFYLNGMICTKMNLCKIGIIFKTANKLQKLHPWSRRCFWNLKMQNIWEITKLK
jgi:hypothetical protein